MTKRKFALDAVLAQPWAIKPEWIKTICDIAQRQGEDPKALEHRLGRPLGAARSSVRDGVATIPVTGPIFPRANLMTENSGATSLDMLALDLAEAMADDAVHAVILDIDSPGGVVNGIGEAASMIAAASAQKPVVAYSGGLMASAAYWLASAASEIVIDKAAILGSIGVVTAVSVQEHHDMHGYRDIEVVSTHAPNKRPDPRTDEGLQEIRGELDALESVFIETVAENRGLTPDAVVERFGAGGVKIGAEAVAAGMADRLGSYEQVLAELATRPENSPAAIATRHQTSETIMDISKLTADQLKADRPDLVAAIEKDAADKASESAKAEGETAGHAAGHAEGVKAERERIAGLEENALSGYEAVLAECKADGKSTGGDLAVKIVALQKAEGSDALAKRRADAAAAAAKLPATGAVPVVDPAASAGATPLTDDAARAQWEQSADLQAEFATCDAYVAWAKADRAGRVKVLGRK